MIVLVTGGRTYANYIRVWQVLDDVLAYCLANRIELAVLQGGATGADEHARDWCENRFLCCFSCHAWWTRGKSAGPIRNGWMAHHLPIDYVLAFPGGSGTESMKKIARAKGIKVAEYA